MTPEQAIYTGLVGAGSALCGAWAAFRLEVELQKRREKARRASALRKALLVLGSHRNFLLRHAPALEDHETDPLRYVLFRPLHIVGPSLTLDFDELSFLAELPDSTLLSELEEFDLLLRELVSYFERRAAMHVQLQNRSVAAGGQDQLVQMLHERKDDDEFERVLLGVVGPDVALPLRTLTDEVYRLHARALGSSKTLFVKTQDAMRLLCRGARVPRLQNVTLDDEAEAAATGGGPGGGAGREREKARGTPRRPPHP